MASRSTQSLEQNRLKLVPRAGVDGERPRVVIVGAGFGGLTAAKRLAKTPVNVTLVDRENHHLFQPLLYQVATASRMVHQQSRERLRNARIWHRVGALPIWSGARSLETQPVERTLAAILPADVEGYSRLVGQDGVGTLRTLTPYRSIIDRSITAILAAGWRDIHA
jgi:2-polyprenyl-6-methoxyphenol hydroxylase-like FAD-dependent oxidoreductase